MKSAHIAYGHNPEVGSAFVTDGSDLALVILDLRPGDLIRLADLAADRDLARDLLAEAENDLVYGRWHPDMGVAIDLGDGHSLSMGLVHTDESPTDALIDLPRAGTMLSTSLSAGVTELLARFERDTDDQRNTR